MNIIFSIVSGVLLSLSHPGHGFYLLSFIAFIPLMMTFSKLNKRRLFSYCFISGFVYYFLITDWIRILYIYDNSRLLFIEISIAAALFQALFWGGAGYLYGVLKKHSSLYLFVFPALFTIIEWVRSLGVFGNTVGSIAYHQAANQFFAPIAAIAGSWGIIFIVLMINELLLKSGQSVIKRKYKKSILYFSLLVVILIITTGYSLYVKHYTDRVLMSTPKISFAIMQPAIEQEKKLSPRYYPELKRYYLNSIESFKRKVDFIILPETIVAEFLLSNKSFMWNLSINAGSNIIFGTPVKARGKGYYNSMVMFDNQTSETEVYNKVKVVPFGEYLPGRKIISFLLGKDFVNRYFGSDYHPGTIIKPLANIFAPAICFESFMPAVIRTGINEGGKAILVITNDGWFKNTSMLREHQAVGRIRAIENSRFLIQAANTGFSFVCAPDGRIIKQLDLNRRGWLTSKIPLLDKKAFYTIYGDSLIFILIIYLFLSYYLVLLRRHK